MKIRAVFAGRSKFGGAERSRPLPTDCLALLTLELLCERENE